MYFRAFKNERTSIIKLRSYGYSINHISKALGRSTSWIHATIKKAELLGVLHHFSNRKLPRRTLLIQCRRRLNSCLNYMKAWEAFIFGQEEEPP